jgi:hypothetical protein
MNYPVFATLAVIFIMIQQSDDLIRDCRTISDMFCLTLTTVSESNNTHCTHIAPWYAVQLFVLQDEQQTYIYI